MFPSSRGLATAIRVRQELTKRFLALRPAPRWEGPRSLLALLKPDGRARTLAEHPAELARWLSESSASRYPSTHLATRPIATLPSRSELVADIARVERGAWDFLGTPVSYQGSEVDWIAQPVSGERYPDLPWNELPLIGGVPGDVKLVWELNRHRELVRLAQGYALLRDENLARRLAALLERWIDQNPPGRGINWASSLEVSYRAIAWCWIWHLTRTSAVWESELLPRFLWSLWHHARHIERYDSIHHSPNTHLTGEALGLLYVGLLFPEFGRSARWVAAGSELLVSELEFQVLSDGMHFERATGYHRYTVEIYAHCAILARAFGLEISEPVERALRPMLAVSQMLARPDGTWPIIGDEDSGSVLQLMVGQPDDQRPMLAVGAGLLRESRWALGAGPAARATGWWLLDDESWDALVRMPNGELPAAAFALDASGYYGTRESRSSDSWYCVVDAGPHGGDRTGHAHTDLGHVEIARGDVAVVADPGSSSYTADLERRDHERSERSHACLFLPDAALAHPRGPFAWRSVAVTPRARSGSAEHSWWCEVSYTRSASESASDHVVHHRRTVVLVRSLGVVVHDEVESAAGVDGFIHWPVPHAITDLRQRQQSIEGPGFGIAWATEPERDGGRSCLEATSYSPAYGVRRPAALLRIALPKARDAAVVTAFTANASEIQSLRSDKREFTLVCGGSSARITLHAGSAPVVQWIDAAVPACDSVGSDSSSA